MPSHSTHTAKNRNMYTRVRIVYMYIGGDGAFWGSFLFRTSLEKRHKHRFIVRIINYLTTLGTICGCARPRRKCRRALDAIVFYFIRSYFFLSNFTSLKWINNRVHCLVQANDNCVDISRTRKFIYLFFFLLFLNKAMFASLFIFLNWWSTATSTRRFSNRRTRAFVFISYVNLPVYTYESFISHWVLHEKFIE